MLQYLKHSSMFSSLFGYGGLCFVFQALGYSKTFFISNEFNLVFLIFQWIGVGFAMAHPAVSNISQTAFGADGWIGVLPLDPYVGNWIDLALLIILGGVPWQVSSF